MKPSPASIPSYYLCPTGKGENSTTLVRRVLEGCPVWGFTEGNRVNFRRHMQPGDILLFTAPGTGVFKEWAWSRSGATTSTLV
jgi:hypothetical protein